MMEGLNSLIVGLGKSVGCGNCLQDEQGNEICLWMQQSVG
jgi:hypothetical protein